MANNTIAVVPLKDYSFVVWFEEGISRRYDALEFGVPDLQTHQSVRVKDDCSGIEWNNGLELDSNRLASLGQEVDFVTEEKRRLLKDLADIRRNASFSQTRLGEAAGIRQSVISRIEGCEISPQINTLLKLLAPLGKTLSIVDLTEA